MPDSLPADLLLRVRNLCKHFGPVAAPFKALDNVNFDVRRGQTLGIVGESGSGKTTVARCVLRAMDPTSGSVLFNSTTGPIDLARLSPKQLKPLRRQMQMIFQDPYSSLNPGMTVGQIVTEPLIIHRIGTRKERQQRVAAMLDRVGLSPSHIHRYPHAFSGGQRQRIGIARALILRPALVIADESVSALDVSVRARVLQLLRELQLEMGVTYIFVSHDLGVIRQICHDVVVMHKGRVMEAGPTPQVFDHPQHAYTRVLLSAIPKPDPDRPMQALRVSDLTAEQLEPLPSVF